MWLKIQVKQYIFEMLLQLKKLFSSLIYFLIEFIIVVEKLNFQHHYSSL